MARSGEDRPSGPGVGLAAFTTLVILGALLGLLGIVGSVWSLADDARRLRALAAAGVLDADAPLQAWRVHGAGGVADGGCAVQGGRLIRWDAGARTGDVSLEGAQVERVGEHVRVQQGPVAVACPVGRGEEAALFEALLREASLPRSLPPDVRAVP